MTRRSDPSYTDEVAVERCARGEIRQRTLTWQELEAVIRLLEPRLPDIEISARIGASPTFVALIRRRRGLPRLQPVTPPPGIGPEEAARILGWTSRLDVAS